MRKPAVLGGLLTVLLCGLGVADAMRLPQDQIACNQVSLGSALMVDTAKLKGDTVYIGASPIGEESNIIAEKFHSAGTLRAVKVTTYGETVAATDTYYLLAKDYYAVEHSEVYRFPSPSGSGLDTVSRFKQYFYFCDGSLVDFRREERAEYLHDLLVKLAWSSETP